MNLFLGFARIQKLQLSEPVPKKLLEQLASQINKLRNLLSRADLAKLRGLFEEMKFDNKVMKMFEEQSLDHSVTSILEALNLTDHANSIKEHFKIVNIDWEKSTIEVKNKVTDQTLTIIGCKTYPSNEFRLIQEKLRESDLKYSLLLIEDTPLLMTDENIEQLSENSNTTFNIHDTYEGDELEEFASIYTRSTDIFKYNPDEKLVYNVINPQTLIPNEIGSIVANFSNDQPEGKKVNPSYFNDPHSLL